MHNIWANKSLNIPVSSGISMIFKSLERVANFKINTNTLTVQKKNNQQNKQKTHKNTQDSQKHTKHETTQTNKQQTAKKKIRNNTK